MTIDKLMIYAALVGAGHANLMRGDWITDVIMWGIVLVDVARYFVGKYHKENV